MSERRALPPLSDALADRLRAAAAATRIADTRTWLPEPRRWRRRLTALWRRFTPGSTGPAWASAPS